MPSYRRLPSGLWQATVRMPNGKRSTHTDKLKSVVKEWATDLEARYKRGERRDPRAGETTLGEWRERVTGSRRQEAPTVAKNDSLWRTHCEPQWADWPMNAVTRAEAQAWVKRLETTRRARHRGKDVGEDDAEVPLLSAATVVDTVHVMTTLYQIAMAEEPPLVGYNPFARLDLPKIQPRPVQFYERDEAAALYAALEESGRVWRTLAELGMDVGLRPGEIYGLHTDRLDRRRNLVQVTRVMTRYGLREYPKSKKSHRNVPVPPATMAAISADLGGRRNWAGECTCPKVAPDGTTAPGRGPCKGLVFRAAEGGPIDDSRFRERVWMPAVRAAGIRRFPPSIMRHTAASWLVQDGVPLYDVQKLLGHEDFTTTQRYAHLAPDAHDKVRESWRRRSGG